jgi:superfamily I DNA/RNA helicase
MTEYHVYGPPGTGKTTHVAREIGRAVAKHGDEGVMVLSFTKAAATEIASRDIPLQKKMFGTLHSLCYRALGAPEIAEVKAAEWNELNPEYAITKKGAQNIDDGLEQPSFSARGDELLATVQLNRARMTPEELWPLKVRRFYKAWNEWKDSEGYYDFTDLIEKSIQSCIYPPHQPKVIFVDEAQDLSKLQFTLVRQWAGHTDMCVMVGDDDQCIYTFAGADPRNLIAADLPDDHKIVLKKSYRLSRAIHARCAAWIEQCSERQPKEFEPTDRDGEIVTPRYGDWRTPEPLLDDMLERTTRGETCMVLASCGYMLPPMLALMRERGVLFHNPYRVTRGDWNPLRRSEGSMASRIQFFLDCGEDNLFPNWTAYQLNMWIDLIDGKRLLKRGSKKAIKELAGNYPGKTLNQDDWMQYFDGDPFGFEPITLKWLVANVRDSKRKAMDYPARVIQNNGVIPQAKIVIGTIHSVKGGEADNVYLFPDISNQAYGEWRATGPRKDTVLRTFYVGMSRARSRLVLPNPVGGVSVDLRGV